MATYTQLSNGMSGEDVKKLQQSLVDKGYSVGSSGVDGIYGSATESAVKRYQQDNGLQVDGIAGDQTLGSLYKVNSSAATGNQQLTATTQDGKPVYQGTYDQQLNDLYQQIVNRDKFSYNVNEDALYQQYADQYVQQGKLAMQDAMGMASALTGGYGNSYAQSVGQQTYQGYLQKLNDIVPELHSLARAQYDQEGQDLLTRYSMLGDMRDTEYQRYQDDLNQYWQDKSFKYTQERDAVADKQWEASFNYQKSKSSGGGQAAAAGIDDAIMDKVKTFTNQSDLANYLNEMEALGYISLEQADKLFALYKPDEEFAPLEDRNWSVVDDGGLNWFWGVDRDAVVQDESGNSYRLDSLVNELVASGYSKSEAKDYVKNLQKRLGI